MPATARPSLDRRRSEMSRAAVDRRSRWRGAEMRRRPLRIDASARARSRWPNEPSRHRSSREALGLERSACLRRERDPSGTPPSGSGPREAHAIFLRTDEALLQIGLSSPCTPSFLGSGSPRRSGCTSRRRWWRREGAAPRRSSSRSVPSPSRSRGSSRESTRSSARSWRWRPCSSSRGSPT